VKAKSAVHLILWLCFTLSIACTYSARAEDDVQKTGYKVYTLGQIVVTGKRQTEQQTGISTIMTAEEIKATNSHTVSEALRYMPGVYVSTGLKNEPAVRIHGFDQSRILVLIDGVPYSEAKYGRLPLNQITTDNVSEIIVEKGNQSVLYGANAEGGVINIITKQPLAKPSISAQFQLAEKNAQEFSISHGMKLGMINYWLNYTHKESDAWKLSDKFSPRIGTIRLGSRRKVKAYLENGGKFRDNSDYKNDSFWAKVGIEPSADSEYYVNFHYTATDEGSPSSVDSVKVFSSRPAFSYFARMPKYDDWGIDLSGRQKVADKLTFKAKLFYHNHIDDYVSYADQTFRNKMAVSRYKDYMAGGMLLADFKPVQWDSLKMAVHYRGDSHKQRDDDYLPFAESFAYTGSVALENTFTYIKNCTVLLGASYDWYKVDRAELTITDRSTGDFIQQEDLDTPARQNEINPMIGVTYTFLDSTRFFASVARKTSFPTLGQLYSTRSGNLQLKSEKSINYAIGISRSFGQLLKLKLSPFYHDISDRITRDAPHSDGTYRNYAKVKMTGAEFSADLTPVEDLFIRADYTYNHARDKSSGQVTNKVTGIPKHKINANVEYTLPYLGTRVDLTMVYQSKSYSQLPTATKPDTPILRNDTYTVFNAKISQKFLKHLEAFIYLDNIFDKNYEPESGIPAPGRTAWLGMSAKF